MRNISWWNIEFGEEEVFSVTEAIRSRHIGQGALTEEFEAELSQLLGVPHVVCTTSGTSALMMACLACGVGPGDEVIVPNRTFVATANAAMLLGARIKLIDVHPHRPVMDPGQLEAKISSVTKAIIPVHVNGCAADLTAIGRIAERHGIPVIEDSAQALMSRSKGRFLGTSAKFGCFSLGLAKIISTGQGGFVVCSDRRDYEKLRLIRNQGIREVKAGCGYQMLAGNFKFTDIQAAIGLSQLKHIQARAGHLVEIYRKYQSDLAGIEFLRQIEADLEEGEVPLRALFLCSDKNNFISRMRQQGIVVVPEDQSLNRAAHLRSDGAFGNSDFFEDHLVILPSGPDQALARVAETAVVIREMATGFESLRP